MAYAPEGMRNFKGMGDQMNVEGGMRNAECGMGNAEGQKNEHRTSNVQHRMLNGKRSKNKRIN